MEEYCYLLWYKSMGRRAIVEAGRTLGVYPLVKDVLRHMILSGNIDADYQLCDFQGSKILHVSPGNPKVSFVELLISYYGKNKTIGGKFASGFGDGYCYSRWFLGVGMNDESTYEVCSRLGKYPKMSDVLKHLVVSVDSLNQVVLRPEERGDVLHVPEYGTHVTVSGSLRRFGTVNVPSEV